MFLFETHRSEPGNYVYHQSDKNLNYAVHLHNSYEFVVCLAGNIRVNIEDDNFALKSEDSILIPPMRAHSFVTPESSETYLCVFSVAFIKDFYEKHKDLQAVNPVVSLADAARLVASLKKSTNYFERKGLFYLIAANEEKNTQYCRYDNTRFTQLHQIINYISQNFTLDISMRNLSDALGYSYNYTSAIFKKIFEANFLDVINSYRIEAAARLLPDTEKTITQIATGVGYSSLRSFNRNFMKYTGKTPTEFRKSFTEES